MMRFAMTLAAIALAVPALADDAPSNTDLMLLQIAAMKSEAALSQALLARVRADSEAEKATLIEWLKAAQDKPLMPEPPK